MTRHYLTVDALSAEDLTDILDRADELKAGRLAHPRHDLAGKSVALLFEKASTRTRVSFEVAVHELGGHPVVLDGASTQLGRGEALEDTARVLNGYVHALVMRTYAQSRLEALAAASTIPVINALSDFEHPCQALADLQTVREYKGTLEGVKLAWVGDGNNVAHSLVKAGAMAGMHVAVASPPGYEPIPQVVEAARNLAEASGGRVTLTTDPAEAVKDADVVSTDVWASMGQERESEERRLIFSNYAVNRDLLASARPDVIVLHCLPAHRGEEITADVLDGEASVVWVQAENRLHTSKALLAFLLA